MPAAEATDVDITSYELAFHVLPTVAEGEVEAVFKTLKDIITTHGGAITLQEAPERFDLAYEIVRYLEGRNRKFSSAYFGWIRFTADPAQIDNISQAVTEVKELLRHMLIKLSKNEEEHPFYFHEALEEPQVENIEVDAETAVVEPAKTETEAETETEATEEESQSEEKEAPKDGEADAEKV